MGKNHLLNKTKYSEAGHLNVRIQKSEIQPLAFISPTFYTSIKYVTEGDNVTLECAATGVPPPQLNWSFTSSTGKLKHKNHRNKKYHLIYIIVQETKITICSVMKRLLSIY